MGFDDTSVHSPVDLAFIVLFIRDEDGMLAECAAQGFYNGREVQVRVRNMERQNAVGPEVTGIEFQRLSNEQRTGQTYPVQGFPISSLPVRKMQ